MSRERRYSHRMLQSLRVRNLAVVENAQVEFSHGLNIITGETGAGKSIIIGALGLVLGERADRSLIRTGAEQGAVEASFELADSSAVDSILEELGLEPCENGRMIIRRTIALNGTTKNVINDCPTTLQAVKRIGNVLVDMHGPYDHQSLLSQESQLDLLDAFGHTWDLRATYEKAHAATRKLEDDLQELEGDAGSVSQQIDFLSHQVKEIESAALSPEEDQSLVQEHTQVANAQRIWELSNTVQNTLFEGEYAAYGQLVAAERALQELSEILPEAAEWKQVAESLVIELQELTRCVSERAASVEGDPARLQWLEDRLALVHRLKRKYGASISAILESFQQAKAKLADLENREERMLTIRQEIEKKRKDRDRLGYELSERRSESARRLAKEVTKELRDLGFARSSFRVTLTNAEPKATGMNDVDFEFAPNPGEPAGPLRSIASSGEISRVMLATKAVLAAHDQIPVLVFDEIDANIGGEMGTAIGDKLMRVSKNHQVLCITHLPQVAIHGASHFVVEKSVRQERTFAGIRKVDDAERVEEIARMLGGKDLTSVTLTHAREMLASAANKA